MEGVDLLAATIVTLLVTTASCSLEHVTSRGGLQPRDHTTALAGHCGWGERNLLWLEHYNEQDVPVVVLDEDIISCFGSAKPRPTVAIWEDGRIVFIRKAGAGFEKVQGVIPRAEVRSLVHDVAAKLTSSDRRHDTNTSGHILSGTQITTIIVRDGDRWRASTIDGASEDDFRDAVAGVSQPPPNPTSTVDFDVGLPTNDPPPRTFAELYVRLLESRPANAKSFVPYAYDIDLLEIDHRGLGSGRWDDEQRRSVAWPSDLPTPPDDVVPGRCENSLDAERQPCEYALDPSYNATVERHQREGTNRVRVKGALYYLRATELYAGERTIRALMECNALISRSKR